MDKEPSLAQLEAEEAEGQRRYQEVLDSFDRTEQIVYSLPKCLECGAVVESDDREKHYYWHRSLERAR